MSMPPLVFEPYFRPQVWGGRSLESLLGKTLPGSGPYGESWEISAHPHHVSRVSGGPFDGKLLSDLTRERPKELFGANPPADERFPLLLKILDCKKLLSIQVHPSDEVAARLLQNERGKTEAWVILDVEPEGRIYAGLKEGVGQAELQEQLKSGTVDRCLHEFRPKPGDCVFIPAGTVHSVGGGVVMAEVQQSSDATFRLFDWNRLGPDGKARKLHVKDSLASIDFDAGPREPQLAQPLTDLPEPNRGETLAACEYFVLQRFYLAGSLSSPYCGSLSMWMVTDGEVELAWKDGRMTFEVGQSVLIPAETPDVCWDLAESIRSATLLGISLPS